MQNFPCSDAIINSFLVWVFPLQKITCNTFILSVHAENLRPSIKSITLHTVTILVLHRASANETQKRKTVWIVPIYYRNLRCIRYSSLRLAESSVARLDRIIEPKGKNWKGIVINFRISSTKQISTLITKMSPWYLTDSGIKKINRKADFGG